VQANYKFSLSDFEYPDMEMLDLPVGMRSPDSGIDDLADLDRLTPVFSDVMMSDMTNLPMYSDAMLTSSMMPNIELDLNLLKNEDLFDLSSLDNLSSVASECSPLQIGEENNFTSSEEASSISTEDIIPCDKDVCIELDVPVKTISPNPTSTSTTPRSPSPCGSDWSEDYRPVRRNRKKLTAEQVLRKAKNSPIKPKRKQNKLSKKLKLYEVNCPLNNPEAEKCRLNAINAKKNRERKKAELQIAAEEIALLRSENAELREQAENVREELDHALSEIQELKSLMKLAGIPVGNKRKRV